MSLAPMNGKVAVVTGSSAGNGRAISMHLSVQGATVICADLRPDPHSPHFDGEGRTHELIQKKGGNAIFQQTDVTDSESITELYERTVKDYGRLDIVVVNAGISPQPPVHLPEEDFETFQRVTKVNQEGSWWTAREGSRIMREQGTGGSIVFVSSIAGLVGSDSGAHYCMSKGAINQLTRALAFQMAPYEITVNAVAPGFIRTSMTEEYLNDPSRRESIQQAHPLGRVGETSDVAGAVGFLAGPQARWITGVILPVDGGYTAV